MLTKDLSSFTRTRMLCYATLPDGQGFEASIAAAARAGFDELSLWLMTIDEARAELGSLQAVRDCLDHHGMRATSIELLHAWPRGDAPNVEQEVDVMRAAIDVFEPELIMAGCMDDVIPDGDWAIQALRQECAALSDVRIGLEFLPWSALPNPTLVREFVEAVDAPNLGYVLDTWHFVRSGMDYAALQQIPGEKIFFIQASDVAEHAGDDMFAETLGGRLLPGEGVIDWPRLISVLREMGVHCPVGTEQFSDVIKAMPIEEAAETLYAGLQYPFTSVATG